MAFHHRAKQNWSVGETVKVGFITDLEVIKKIPTPGDFRPDEYVLRHRTSNRFYRFTPHYGIERRNSLEDALA